MVGDVARARTGAAMPRLFARSEATLRRLVAGKAPWQTARFACRPARCACRSSSQKSRCAAIFGSPVLPLVGFRRGPTIPTYLFLRTGGDVARARTGAAMPRLFAQSEATLRRLVAGKAPWQTARFACRPARCACRSSSQKSRCAAIFGSPVLPLVGFRREPTIPYIEKAALHGRLFQYKIINVFGTALSFKTRSLHSLRSGGMTGTILFSEILRLASLAQDDRKESLFIRAPDVTEGRAFSDSVTDGSASRMRRAGPQ